MHVDIDRPSTWRRYTAGLCNGCVGGCCRMPVEISFEDLLRLGVVTTDDAHASRRKLVNRLKKEGVIASYREVTGLFMLAQKGNRDCVFMNSDTRLCTVYDKRPGVCRQFPSIGPRPGFCPETRASRGRPQI